MTKVAATLVGLLAFFGIALYTLMLIYEKFGSIGTGFITFISVGLLIYYSFRKDKKTFDNLVLYVLHNRLHPDEAKKMNLQLARSNFSRSALIRNLQIIRDSIEIALTSKKRDTAESRMNTLL